MTISPEISFFSVMITIVAIGILGFLVFFSNRKSITNKAFLFFSITTIIWSLLNYLSYQFYSPEIVLWILRFVMFSAVWHSFSIFTLFYVSPYESIYFPMWYKLIVLPLVIFVSFFTLTPLVFEKISVMSTAGGAEKVVNGPAIAIFGLSVIGLIFGGFILLVNKILNKKDAEKKQLIFLLIGALSFVALLIIFNFILPAFFNYPYLIPLSAVFAFPYIAFTSYAILKHGLFNVKVIATELLVFAIWIAVLIEFLMENTLKDRLFTGAIFIFVVVAGIFLIRSVKKEVAQREELEKLSHELQHANAELKELDKAKSEFISIVSHQLRTPLSITKGYVSMILEGIYGKITDKLKETLEKVYITNEGLIDLVNNLLDLSRMEAGTIKYEFKDADLVSMVGEIVMELDLEAKHRNLYLKWTKPAEQLPLIKADTVKLKQVIEILIENSLKYTPNGGVEVFVEKKLNSLLFKVKDTGIGINPHELDHLFQKFGRGAEGSKVNVTGVGLGLYAAKQIVLKHGGEIWAESEGVGKGSIFCVSLPFIIEQDKSIAELRSGEGK